jgi:hypothetical protein
MRELAVFGSSDLINAILTMPRWQFSRFFASDGGVIAMALGVIGPLVEVFLGAFTLDVVGGLRCRITRGGRLIPKPTEPVAVANY